MIKSAPQRGATAGRKGSDDTCLLCVAARGVNTRSQDNDPRGLRDRVERQPGGQIRNSEQTPSHSRLRRTCLRGGTGGLRLPRRARGWID